MYLNANTLNRAQLHEAYASSTNREEIASARKALASATHEPFDHQLFDQVRDRLSTLLAEARRQYVADRADPA